MKQIIKPHMLIATIVAIASGLSGNVAYAGSYTNPDISEVSPILSSEKSIAPNIFLMLDDSGSMDATMPYDPNTTYELPPNPNSFNERSESFDAFPAPTTDPRLNGFRANGIPTNDYSFSNACMAFTPTGKTVTLRNNGREFFGSDGYFYQYVNNVSNNVIYSQNTYTDHSDSSTNCRIFKSFYSTRILALKSALAIALASENGRYLLDFDFINNRNTDSLILRDMGRSNLATYKTNMYALLRALYAEDASGGTPIRQQVLNLYNRIRVRAGIANNSNLYLPADETTYSSDKLLSCKQNYGIILSDGAYNGSLSASYSPIYGYTAANDPDSKEYSNIIWQTSDITASDSLEDTKDIEVNFKGDGSVAIQRLFAGGRPSLTSRRNTLSDITFQAWLYDLNASLSNRVKPTINAPGNRDLVDSDGNVLATLPEIWNPENDPANWQRIVTYTIGLGLGEEWTDESMAAVINGNSDNTTTYRDGTSRWNNDVIADFARSGYVGRGGFTRADSAKELVDTFKAIFAETIRNSGTKATSGATISTGQITTETDGIILTANLDPGLRTGNLYGNWLYSGVIADNPATTEIEGTRPGDARLCYGTTTLPSGAFVGQLCTASSAKWNAAQAMPAWSDRKIFSFNPTTEAGINFNYPEMDDSQKRHIINMFGTSKITSIVPYWEWYDGISTLTANKIVNFLKGKNTLASNDDIRSRPDGQGSAAPLGDFGRGGAHYLGAPSRAIWGRALSTAENKRAVAFIGGNDGMLHAFDAKNGQELFAYVPNTVYQNLNHLVLPNSEHQAFVDGKINTQDIDGGKTILVAGLGAGGKGLFALDVTDPSNFDKSKVLWEINEKTDSRIGRIFGTPSIIRVEGKYKGSLETTDNAKKNRWVVAVGTGYNNNTNGNIQNGVMIIDALSGKIIDFLALPGAEGVGEITWIDHQKHNSTSTFASYFGDDNDSTTSRATNDSLWGEPDRGYVGDLKGNVWVIDFAYDSHRPRAKTKLKSAIIAKRNDGRANLKALSPKVEDIPDGSPAPLFIATDTDGNRQPITAKITISAHPSNRGYMVYFGTGELFKTVPFSSDTPNSMYGVWDDIGDNYGSLPTADITDNNTPRDRFYLTYYPWELTTTTFSDGSSAYARVPKDGRYPLPWANFQGREDSTSVSPEASERTVAASGWVVNTGKNSTIPQYERVFQAPYTVVNKKNEEGLTFLMHTVKEDDDPCNADASAYTWAMTFRTDIIDGPFAPFSYAPTDINGDGVIDANDKIIQNGNPGTYIVPLGAVPSSSADQRGKPMLEYAPVIIRGGRGTKKEARGDFCPNGETVSYTKVLSTPNAAGEMLETVKVCLPQTMSSWSEIE